MVIYDHSFAPIYPTIGSHFLIKFKINTFKISILRKTNKILAAMA
jgi:hypothetical protein